MSAVDAMAVEVTMDDQHCSNSSIAFEYQSMPMVRPLTPWKGPSQGGSYVVVLAVCLLAEVPHIAIPILPLQSELVLESLYPLVGAAMGGTVVQVHVWQWFLVKQVIWW